MVSAVAALALACLVSAFTTPFVRAWALRRGVVDEPGGRRVHAEVTPRLGGVALLVGFFAPMAVFAGYGTEAMNNFMSRSPGELLGLIGGAVVVAGVGAVDDVRGVGPWPKLGAQAVAAAIAYFAGFRIEAVGIPGFGSLELGYFAAPVTFLWFLGITNALNLIDGLDGLAAGIALIASVANFVIAFSNGAFVVALLSASLAGSLLGFLRYNFNPAKIFMGDSGSMFLGFVLAATSIRGATTKSSTAVAILAPMVALGVPIFDTMLAMIRRTLAKQSLFAADRGHIHHRLLDLGLTHRRVVLVLYLSSIVLALAAVGIAFGRSWELGASLVLVGGVLFILVRLAGAVQRANRPLAGPAEHAAALEALRRRSERALGALRGCNEVSDIQRILAGLASDRRLLRQAELRPRARGEALRGVGAAELRYPLGTGSDQLHALEIKLNPHLAPLSDEARVILARVAEACEEALERAHVRTSHPELVAAG